LAAEEDLLGAAVDAIREAAVVEAGAEDLADEVVSMKAPQPKWLLLGPISTPPRVSLFAS
jgi:hypothetical protein